MHPSKVDRSQLKRLTDLPNVGKATVADLVLLGIQEPTQLVGKCPIAMYQELCQKTGQRHDPCVIDVFLSITRFMGGAEPQSWWKFTVERQKMVADGVLEQKNRG